MVLADGVTALSPFTGDGHSSFDFRFSGRGGKNAVGDVDGVLEQPVLLLELLEEVPVTDTNAGVVVVIVVLVLVPVAVVVPRPPLPFAPPFRNLL